MNLEITGAAHFSIPDLMGVMNRAFDGYVGGTLKFEVQSFLSFLAREGVDLSISSVLMSEGMPIGLALIARRGWSIRLATMGIVPEATEQGAGKWFMTQLIESAQARGDHHFELEVIEQNPRGVRLYESVGFEVIRRLSSYRGENLTGIPDSALQSVDISEVARALVAGGAVDLPWQVSGFYMVGMGAPNVAYRLNHAYALLSNPHQPAIVLRGVFVPPEYREQGEAVRLLQAIFAAHPGKTWIVPAFCPEEYGFIFEKVGLLPDNLSQFQMGRILK